MTDRTPVDPASMNRMTGTTKKRIWVAVAVLVALCTGLFIYIINGSIIVSERAVSIRVGTVSSDVIAGAFETWTGVAVDEEALSVFIDYYDIPEQDRYTLYLIPVSSETDDINKVKPGMKVIFDNGDSGIISYISEDAWLTYDDLTKMFSEEELLAGGIYSKQNYYGVVVLSCNQTGDDSQPVLCPCSIISKTIVLSDFMFVQ